MMRSDYGVRYAPGRHILVLLKKVLLLVDDFGTTSASVQALFEAINSESDELIEAEVRRLATCQELRSLGLVFVGDSSVRTLLWGDITAEIVTGTCVLRVGALAGLIHEQETADVAGFSLQMSNEEALDISEGHIAERGSDRAERVTWWLEPWQDLPPQSSDDVTSQPVGVLRDLTSDDVGAEPNPDLQLIDLLGSYDNRHGPLPMAPATVAPADVEAPLGQDGVAAAAPQVQGVRCPVDHHNHPNTSYCTRCGRRMGINQTLALQPGPRPPLGLFILDDGMSLVIARDLVIGRNPHSYNGPAEPVEIMDASAELSRQHLGIRLQGWDVQAIDLASSNGTWMRQDGSPSWSRLPSDQHTTLQTGDTLRVGSRELRLELHHTRTN